MLQGEHSAILSSYIKLSFIIKIFVLSIFEWPFYTGFTVKSDFSAHQEYFKTRVAENLALTLETLKK